jgi:hypothetical protein
MELPCSFLFLGGIRFLRWRPAGGACWGCRTGWLEGDHGWVWGQGSVNGGGMGGLGWRKYFAGCGFVARRLCGVFFIEFWGFGNTDDAGEELVALSAADDVALDLTGIVGYRLVVLAVRADDSHMVLCVTWWYYGTGGGFCQQGKKNAV